MAGILDFLFQNQGGQQPGGGLLGLLNNTPTDPSVPPNTAPGMFGRLQMALDQIANPGLRLQQMGEVQQRAASNNFNNAAAPGAQQPAGMQPPSTAAPPNEPPGGVFGGMQQPSWMMGASPNAAPSAGILPQFNPQQPQPGMMPPGTPGGLPNVTPPPMQPQPAMPQSPAGPQPMAPQAGMPLPTSPSYYNRVVGVESNNNPTARNPNSTAYGAEQFTKGTWLDNFNKTFPQHASLPDDQKLALRADSNYSKPVFETFTKGNEAALTRAGVPISDMSRYAAHFFGADDASKVLKASPDTPLANLIQPASIQANPFLRNMTAGQAQQWLASKMGQPAQPATGVPNNPMQSPASFNPQAMIAALGNPKLPEAQRKIGEMMIQNWLKTSEMTNDQKEYLWAKSQGYKGEFADYQKEMKAAGGTNVTVNTAGEKSYNQTIGKGYADTFLELNKLGRDAQTTKATLGLMEKLIDRPGFYSGSAGPLVNQAQRLGVSLGIVGADRAAPSELFEALSNKAVMDVAGGSLGTGISNADATRITQTVPNIGFTPDGNKWVIGVHRALADRKQEIAQQARTYAASHGGQLDAGFDEHLAKWAAANPLNIEAPPTGALKKPAPTAQAPAAPPPGAPPSAKQAPDGKWYTPDPARPGKYLMVQ